MGWRDGYTLRPLTRLTQTLASERSAYLNAKINAALGFCPEPIHPLDRPQPESRLTGGGANHKYKHGLVTRKDYVKNQRVSAPDDEVF